MRPRVIPVLLVEDGGLVKTINFKRRIYLGDPINTVRLLNDMEVDELVVLDISATKNNSGPNYQLIEDIRNEAFMPLAYGGGVQKSKEVIDLINIGIEKVVFNEACFESSNLIRETANLIGSQSLVASINIKKTFLKKYKIYSYSKRKNIDHSIEHFIKKVEDDGVGEIIFNCVDRDGTWDGYDLELVKSISQHATVPIVACGGAGSLFHLKDVIKAGADAASAGSLFSFQGKDMGVLTNYPDSKTLNDLFYE